MCQQLSAAEIQSLNAMNQRVYAMPDDGQKRWYAEHPVQMYESAAALRGCDSAPKTPGGAA